MDKLDQKPTDTAFEVPVEIRGKIVKDELSKEINNCKPEGKNNDSIINRA